ncbi:ribonuclease H family protein [Shewanella sp. SR44-3]|uniref:ribonuclease H family protein n=1 Tax=unclassified Shewanella TaxID=196818 RepID=UPI0015FBDB36|nr:ribonuclease H family protein [Shewanella sp. SR44-3]MBB1268557.1 viroplasmin family protein [Shewanella sp. SR44-3]
MAKKYYVVWSGRETGIFTSWDQTKRSVDKFPQAKYKSFPTEAQAKAAFAKSPQVSIGVGAKTVPKSASSSKGNRTSVHNELENLDIVLYTDGGCEPNPGKAGSGLALYHKGQLSELWYGLYHPNGTNNTAELNALYQALLIAKTKLNAGHKVQIFSDSQYSIKCITEWAYGWKAKGWSRKGGEIANLEIIKLAHELFDELKTRLGLEHVAAHVGIEGNELADRMSILAIEEQTSAFVKYDKPLDLNEILALRAG